MPTPTPGQITNTVIKPEFQRSAGVSFSSIIATLWGLTLVIAGILVLAFFVWGAFDWLTAGGDSEKTKNAQKRMTNAFIGLILLISTFAILKFILPLIGLNIFCPINWETLQFECQP